VEAGGSCVPGQSELHSETLSQKFRKEKNMVIKSQNKKFNKGREYCCIPLGLNWSNWCPLTDFTKRGVYPGQRPGGRGVNQGG
jgi:hypothetical protein